MSSVRPRWFRWLCLLTASAALLGCGTVTRHHVMSGALAAPHQGPVAIVMEGAPVPGELEEVAIVQAVGHGVKANLPSVIDGLKNEARSLGCTHVVRVRIDQGSGMASGSGVAGRLRAVASPPAMPPPGAGAPAAVPAPPGAPPAPAPTPDQTRSM